MAQALEAFDGAKARVCLNPRRFLLPLIALIKLEDERYEALSLLACRLTVEPFGGVFVLGVEDAVPNETVGRDFQNQRLAASGRALNG